MMKKLFLSIAFIFSSFPLFASGDVTIAGSGTGTVTIQSGSGGGGSTTPGGNNSDVQFNNSGALGGDDNFSYDNSLANLTINSPNNNNLHLMNDGSMSSNMIPLYFHAPNGVSSGFLGQGYVSFDSTIAYFGNGGLVQVENTNGLGVYDENLAPGISLGVTGYMQAKRLNLTGKFGPAYPFTMNTTGTLDRDAYLVNCSPTSDMIITLPNVTSISSPQTSHHQYIVCKINSSTNTISFAAGTSDTLAAPLSSLSLSTSQECVVVISSVSLGSDDGTWYQALYTKPNAIISGGGSSTLAVGTGTASNFTTNITSPTAVISFLGSQFDDATSGTTNFVSLKLITTAGTYGSTTIAPVITINAQGQVISLSSATISGGGGINNQNTLQSGATFYVSSGTIQGKFNVNIINSGRVGQVIQGTSGQSANLQEWQDSSGNIIALIDNLGNFTSGPTSANTGPLKATGVQQPGGRYASIAAGTVGSLFNFDNAGYFAIYASPSISDAGGGATNAYKVFGNTLNTIIGASAFNTTDPGYQLLVQTNGSSKQPLVIQGAVSQSANLQEWQDSSGIVLSSITASGIYTGNGSGLTALQAPMVFTGSLFVGLTSGTSYQAFVPQKAITLNAASFMVDVASAGGSGDTLTCGDAFGHNVSVVSPNAAAAGTFTTTLGSASIAAGTTVYMRMDSGAVTKPQGNTSCTYVMQ